MTDLLGVDGLAVAYRNAVREILGQNDRGGYKERLKLSRRLLGLTQKEFSMLFGLHLETVQNWESQSRPEPSGAAALFIDLFSADPVSVVSLLNKSQRAKPGGVVEIRNRAAKTRGEVVD
jgi:DNA-binding transcriptional regulator YiaG